MTITLTNLISAVAATWCVILVVGGCAVLASRRRDRKAEARIAAATKRVLDAAELRREREETYRREWAEMREDA